MTLDELVKKAVATLALVKQIPKLIQLFSDQQVFIWELNTKYWEEVGLWIREQLPENRFQEFVDWVQQGNRMDRYITSHTNRKQLVTEFLGE